MSFPPQGTDTLTNPVIQGTVNPGTGLTLPAFSGVMAGALGATCYVVANNAKAEVKAHAQALHDAGYPVWVCDGTDDQVEIQAAIDALPAGGGKVLLMEGTFYVRASINPRLNTTLAGVGPSTVIKVPDGTLQPGPEQLLRIFYVLNSSHVRFENFTIDGNEPGQPGTWPTPIDLENSPHFHIEGMHLVNSYTAVQPRSESSWGIIANNHFRNQVAGDSIGPLDSHHLQIIGNIIDGTREGIDLQRVTNSVVQGNIIHTTLRGIEVRAGLLGVGSYHNIITGNTIIGPGIVTASFGIHVRDADTKYNIVSNNNIENTGFGIEVGGSDNTISGNALENVAEGIRITTGGDRIELRGNYIANNQNTGIRVVGTVSGIRIINNSFLNTGIAAHHVTIGIMLDNSIDPLVEGNRFYSTHTNKMHTAIHGVVSTRALIRNNFLKDLGALQLLMLAPCTIFTEAHSELFMDVLAASSNHIQTAITPDGLAHTDVTSPDVPRNVMIRITNTDGVNAQTPSGGNIVIEGVDAGGNSASETLVVPATSILPGGTSDLFGSKAFATVNRVTYYSETNTNITVSVGISDKLGLSNVIYAVGDVFKVKRGNADVPVGTVDVANGTVDCATIVNGDDFTIYYRSNLNILA